MGVGVEVAVGVAVAGLVGAAVGVGVHVVVSVGVRLAVGVAVCVSVGVLVAVTVAVVVIVAVCVGVRLAVGVFVGVSVAALLAHGVALLRRAVSLRDRVPNDVLLSDLLQRSGYWAHLALLGEEKAQAIDNVRKFLFQTRAAAESTLGDYLRGIAAERDRGDRVGDARLYGETDDVVTLSTIHSAKGLQWRVMFWCDLERDAKGPHPKVLVGRDSIALKDPLAKDAKQQPAHWQALKEEIGLEEAAERKRVWYVAATRRGRPRRGSDGRV